MLLLIFIFISALSFSLSAMEQTDQITLSIQDPDNMCCSERTNIWFTKGSLWAAFLFANACLLSGFVDITNAEINCGLLKAGIGTSIILLDSTALWLINSIKNE